MKLSSRVKSVAGVVAAIAIFAGCSSGMQSQVNPSGGTSQSALRFGFNGETAGHHRASVAMVDPGPAHSDLRKMGPQTFPGEESLWISDSGTNDVYVYPYPIPSPSATPVATITGFNEPQGECVGYKGDVFIVNTGASNILEYDHDGSLLHTISDPGQYPVGCAFDSRGGDLAVTNIETTAAGSGSVSFYHGPCCNYGVPTTITDPSFGSLYFAGFRPNRNLFVDGFNANSAVSYWKLTYPTYLVTQPGFTPATLIGYPGGVQWDGTNMTVGDQNAGTVNRVNGLGALVPGGTSTLTGAASCDMVQDFIGNGNIPTSAPTRIAAPEAGCAAAVDYPYFYPAPSPQATGIGLSEPIGAAVSKK